MSENKATFNIVLDQQKVSHKSWLTLFLGRECERGSCRNFMCVSMSNYICRAGAVLGLNSGPRTCQAGTLLLESSSQPFPLEVFLE
jgi:hypothetical protein